MANVQWKKRGVGKRSKENQNIVYVLKTGLVIFEKLLLLAVSLDSLDEQKNS